MSVPLNIYITPKNGGLVTDDLFTELLRYLKTLRLSQRYKSVQGQAFELSLENLGQQACVLCHTYAPDAAADREEDRPMAESVALSLRGRFGTELEVQVQP